MKYRGLGYLAVICTALGLSTGAYAQAGLQTGVPQNEVYLDTRGVNDISITYDNENLTLFETDGNDLVLREFMTEDKPSYYARITNKTSSLRIQAGSAPMSKNFTRRVEIGIPTQFMGELSVNLKSGSMYSNTPYFRPTKLSMETGSGTLDGNTLAASEILLSTNSGTIHFNTVEANIFNADTASGSINIGDVDAKRVDVTGIKGLFVFNTINSDNIVLKTTHGSIKASVIEGSVLCDLTNGYISVKELYGSGIFHAKNGEIEIGYASLTGDLEMSNQNGYLRLGLADRGDLQYRAETAHGQIREQGEERGTRVEGRRGRATHKVVLTNTNGGIELSWDMGDTIPSALANNPAPLQQTGNSRPANTTAESSPANTATGTNRSANTTGSQSANTAAGTSQTGSVRTSAQTQGSRSNQNTQTAPTQNNSRQAAPSQPNTVQRR